MMKKSYLCFEGVKSSESGFKVHIFIIMFVECQQLLLLLLLLARLNLFKHCTVIPSGLQG